MILGVLFGAALGDAAGACSEFMTRKEAEAFLRHREEEGGFSLNGWPGRDGSLDKTKDNPYAFDGGSGGPSHYNLWAEGDWTDDTDQQLLLLTSLLTTNENTLKPNFDSSDFAKAFQHWLDYGYKEFGDSYGVGAGSSTKLSGSNPLILTDQAHLTGLHTWAHPFFSATERGGGNGALMRCAILGTCHFWDLGVVASHTRKAATVTHGDPRTPAACLLVTHVVAELLQECDVRPELDESGVERVFRSALAAAEQELCLRRDGVQQDIDDLCRALEALPDDRQQYNKHGATIRECVTDNLPKIQGYCNVDELRRYALVDNLDTLNLEKPPIGFVFSTLACGTWALRHGGSDFKAAMKEIIRRGGDADTNAAVAGALLGARLGYSKLPSEWIAQLKHREWLTLRAERWAKLVAQQYRQSHK